MKHKLLQVACAALIGSSIVMSGCAVVRSQETAPEYVDDTATTTQIKAKMLEDKTHFRRDLSTIPTPPIYI